MLCCYVFLLFLRSKVPHKVRDEGSGWAVRVLFIEVTTSSNLTFHSLKHNKNIKKLILDHNQTIRQIKERHSDLSMYKTLTLPILLCNSRIWSPHYASRVYLLKFVHHKFFRYLTFRLGKPFSLWGSWFR